MEHSKPVTVHASPTRCPFCHEGCDAEVENRVCRDCLARHHAACWAEGAACANCGSGRSMEPSAAAPELTAERARLLLARGGHTSDQVDAFLRARGGESELDRTARLAVAGLVGVGALVLAGVLVRIDMNDLGKAPTWVALGVVPPATALVCALTRRYKWAWLTPFFALLAALIGIHTRGWMPPQKELAVLWLVGGLGMLVGAPLGTLAAWLARRFGADAPPSRRASPPPAK